MLLEITMALRDGDEVLSRVDWELPEHFLRQEYLSALRDTIVQGIETLLSVSTPNELAALVVPESNLVLDITGEDPVEAFMEYDAVHPVTGSVFVVKTHRGRLRIQPIQTSTEVAQA